MNRQMFTSRIASGHEYSFITKIKEHECSLRNSLQVMGISAFELFHFQSKLYIYLETDHVFGEFAWPPVFRKLLESWPGDLNPRHSVMLLDIYHSAVPNEEEVWRTHQPVEQRIGSLARLKPDMFGSYIFYHFQRQEEKPVRENKTYLIGTHESYIFSYQELPETYEEIPAQVMMHTHNTPSNWGEIMEPHLEEWGDVSKEERIWRKIDNIFSFQKI